MAAFLAAINLEGTENADVSGVDGRFVPRRQQHGRGQFAARQADFAARHHVGVPSNRHAASLLVNGTINVVGSELLKANSCTMIAGRSPVFRVPRAAGIRTRQISPFFIGFHLLRETSTISEVPALARCQPSNSS